MRFGAKKQETKKIDDIFGGLESEKKADDKTQKNDIKGNDLLSMMDDL